VANTVAAHLYSRVEPAMNNYQVLARKWRPQNFNQVVGQEHVVTSLVNALQHQRLHHAYLFTGTRGVGKTTLARILAKAINCEQLVDFNPCGHCAICKEIDSGRYLDVIEVDAASRTKVEDTRDLLDNAQYAPNQGQYKVYIIDEVHMLSGHSFNALLKTLEEPPPHVKFLLATTDPHKLPITVLSRCLQFNLKRLLPQQIARQMTYILEQEETPFAPPALTVLARAADGSMRDGLSLLDQAIVYGNGAVNLADVNAMLGMIEQHPVEELLALLAQGNGEALLDKIDHIASAAIDFTEVTQQILHLLHRIALIQHLPTLIDEDYDSQMLQELAKNITPEDTQLYYQIALMGQKDLLLAPDPRSGFDMLMLRMLIFKPKTSATKIAVLPPAKLHSASSTQAKPRATVSEKPVVHYQAESNLQPNFPDKLVDHFVSHDKQAQTMPWQEMISAMKLESITKQLAQHCQLGERDENSVTLLLNEGHGNLLTAMRQNKLQAALQGFYNKPIKLSIQITTSALNTPAAKITQDSEARQRAAVTEIHADPLVQALQETFDARINISSIEPITNK
jgi:DNA polymerase-3 subunit gamma/tau